MNKKSQGGQSLVEMLIGLGVVSVLIASASYGLASVLRISTVSEQTQIGGMVGNSLLESSSALAMADWNKIYNLSKGSANHYFLVNSPTTTPTVVSGDEGVLSGNITYGLVGHWGFDEGGNSWAYDNSGTGNLGTLINAPTRTASTSCKVGDCLTFNGTDNYVDVNSLDNYPNGKGYLTLSVWVKFTTSQNGKQIIGWWYGQNNMLKVVNDKVYFYIDADDALGVTHADSNSVLNDGNWHHIVGTYDKDAGSNNTLLYVDGAVQTIKDTTTGTMVSTSKFNIGSMNDSGVGTYNFEGSLEDVRIYDRALSASEITQLYESPAFVRYFYPDTVKRDNCGRGDITIDDASTCLGASGVSEDPSTQKITVNTIWDMKGVRQTLEDLIYVTRWVNTAAKQTNWDGSSDTAGPITEFSSDYFDYDTISTTTSGSIKVDL
ncbi:prepilin-type N-terminal cleavage/methylation domain-containing protein [Patescibacteria group bacterium]|nr:prepilin-type N-terminal cleavage/methylation domain-containing protein [Patescibacteria group bacterium]